MLRWVGLVLVICAPPAGWATPAEPEGASCTRTLGEPALSAGPVRTLGTKPATVALTLEPGHTYLVEIAERDNDALVEVLDFKGQVLGASDHPERRTGTRRAVVTAPETGYLIVRVTGKEHESAAGTATVRAFELARLQAHPDCLAVMKALAAADADYAAGQAISRGLASSPSGTAQEVYQRAAEGYRSAQSRLTAPGDRAVRGQTQLALAALEYLNLSDWAKTVEWAQAAAASLASQDRYRRARAEALMAAAWIEVGETTTSNRTVPGYGASPGDLLTQARRVLLHLRRFHLQRGERYDAALQSSNIALTYFYESRDFSACVAASEVAGRLFGSLHEVQRRAQAWQNTALCLWGLGRMPEARRLFERAIKDIGPQPLPILYLGVTNNTALMDYALGEFDESLRLFDRALIFANQIDNRRGQGQSLYGIGLDYYALGDAARAREFLTSSLGIRTVALDLRGRMQTLRALATVDVDLGRVDEAIECDHEALRLSDVPATTQRITINLAVHTVAARHPDQARSQLDEVISSPATVDPGIRAEARLQRAILLRRMGRTQDALADLEQARPYLARVGNATEEFAADLELARTLRMAGEPRQALRAVDEALKESDAVRLQTANPEFRLQLQAPLRAAYDLKIELLRARYDDAVAAGKRQEVDDLAAAAFATADASRAHSLADVAAQEYSPEIRRELAPEFSRREALYAQLAGRRFVLESHFDYAGSGDARARRLVSDIVELERKLDAVNILIASRAGARTSHAKARSDRAILPGLPADTALVSYWLGANSAYAWVVLSGSIHWIRLSSPEPITTLAKAFYSSLTHIVNVPVQGRVADSRALSQEVLRPIEPWVAGVTQWVVIPDGALDYVPFAALLTSVAPSEEFVVMRHEVALTSAAWMLDTRDHPAEPTPSRALLLVADPVYQPDDPRLAALPGKVAPIPSPERSGADPLQHGYQRLPFTAREAAGIAAQFPSDAVDELTGLGATRARLLALDWSRYRFIHIATHGVVDAQVPDLSALILGSYDAKGDLVDGGVRVADLSLRTLHADLAVFSACDTALGREVPSEGLVGISSTVLARGAKAVVASLWQVSDEIGADLMTELYRHVLRDSMSPPAALAAAMRSILSRNASADPALWAAYQVSVVALGPGLPIRDRNTATTTRP